MKAAYIIVGSGPAGSAVAARLSENPENTVLLLEAGDENNNELGRAQGTFGALWGTDANWNYQSVPQTHMNNRVVLVPRGKTIGGSSAINIGFWARGAEGDYDGWGELGLDGWNFASALEIFRRVENTDRGVTDPEFRGVSGNVVMETAETTSIIADKLLDAFVEVGLGPIADTNGATPYATSRVQTIHKDKYRHTIGDDYLTAEVRRRPNMTLLTKAYATKVNVETGRAVSVSFRHNGEEKIAEAEREIILCAGAINTPKLLMLSGIGPRDHLEDLGIPVVHDAPAVGSNLQDHLNVAVNVIAEAGVEGSAQAGSGPDDMTEWRFQRTGPATYLEGNGIGFFKLSEDANKPEFEIIPAYNPVLNDPQGEPYFNLEPGDRRSGYSINMVLLHPKSQGVLQLASADPKDNPVIDFNYFGDADDMDMVVNGFREVLKMTQTKALDPYTSQVSPSIDTSDEELKAFVLDNAGSVFHPVGTAKMGKDDDPSAAVDQRLRFKGIIGLRVADASVFPTLISGHTMAPTIYVGEQAAKFILRGE
ncbi:GMC family oxidoreductase [Ruegeria atlantica]|uniref:GMC family oxidoreductase n=1 Tax=Ruegeria atlantica TaxID=81569 RepID=UPI0024945C31|nr:GMC family oxidoreductase N-terminal domain-containing protein [Ruegeria atlantica]